MKVLSSPYLQLMQEAACRAAINGFYTALHNAIVVRMSSGLVVGILPHEIEMLTTQYLNALTRMELGFVARQICLETWERFKFYAATAPEVTPHHYEIALLETLEGFINNIDPEFKAEINAFKHTILSRSATCAS